MPILFTRLLITLLFFTASVFATSPGFDQIEGSEWETTVEPAEASIPIPTPRPRPEPAPRRGPQDLPDPGIGANEWGRSAKRKLEDWASRIPVMDLIDLKDMVEFGNRAQVQFLRQNLKTIINPPQDQEQRVARAQRFGKNLTHTAGKIRDSHKSHLHLSFHELVDFRVKGWGDHQDDSDDVFIMRDLLYLLQDGIDKVGGEYLELVKKRLVDVLSYGLRAHGRDGGRTGAEVLRGIQTIRNARNAREVWAALPYQAIASNRPGYGRFKDAFEWVNGITTFFLLNYRRIYGIEMIFYWAEEEELLSNLRKIGSLNEDLDISAVERSLEGSAGRLSIYDMSQNVVREPYFRDLALSACTAFGDVLTDKDTLRQHLGYLKHRVGLFLQSDAYRELIAQKQSEESQGVLDEFSEGESLSSQVDPLRKIVSVDGVDLSEEQRNEFRESTGLDLDDVIATNGDRGELRDLILREFPDAATNPDTAREKTRAVEQALVRIADSEETAATLGRAADKKVADTLVQGQGDSELFEIRDGKVVFSTTALSQILSGGDTSGVQGAHETFSESLKGARETLGRARSVSSQLDGARDEVRTLIEDLESMGSSEEGRPASESVVAEVREIQSRLSSIGREVTSSHRELEALQRDYVIAKRKLLEKLGLNEEDFTGDATELNEAVQNYLKELAFSDEDLNAKARELFALLSAVQEGAQKISGLAEDIERQNRVVAMLRGQLERISRTAREEIGELSEQSRELQVRHKGLYTSAHYLSDDEISLIREKASMWAQIDGDLANQFALKYLTGYIKEGDTRENFIESIRFHSFEQNSISFDLTLVSRSYGDSWDSVQERQTLSLKVLPKVVKDEENNFDFVIQELHLQKEGEEKVALSTELGTVLDSTLALINQMVDGLNYQPYKELRFRYYSHLSTLRIHNGLPIFESFPNFKVHFIELLAGKISLYGDVSGKKLGEFVGKGTVMEKGETVGESEQGQIQSRIDQAFEVSREGKSDFGDFGDEATESFSQQLRDSSIQPIGAAKVRVHQDLINDFYVGMREGYLSKGIRPITDTSPAGRTSALFNGLHIAKIDFKNAGNVDLFFKGNLQTISKETSSFYSRAISIIAPWQGMRQGLHEGASNVVSFFTFGYVKIEVDPADYKVPSGEFAIQLSGASSFSEPTLNLSFDRLSLYDPAEPGALQPYVKLVRATAAVTRLVGRLRDGIIAGLNWIPGVDIQTSGENLDEVLLTFVAHMLANSINEGVSDLEVKPRNYKSYDISFKDFELIKDIKTRLERIDVSQGNLEIDAQINPE